jgi:methyltransferase (TIGR00027 family)
MHQHPSPTAALSAAARAAHLEVDTAPHVMTDPLAVRLLDELGTAALGYQRAHPAEPVLVGARASTVLRARYAEDRLAASAAAQAVVLGVGLDTTALRAPAGRTWFEVDRAAVLAWRAGLVARAGLTPAADIRAVAVDLGTQPLVPALVAAGLDPAAPAFLTWLGVTMYLDETAARAALTELAALVPGTEVVLDHILPRALRDDAGQAYAAGVAAAAGAAGEPWRWTPGPDELRAVLAETGWEVLDARRDRDAVGPQEWRRSDHLRPMGLVGLVHARSV